MNLEPAAAGEEVLDELKGRFLTFYIDQVLYSIELCHIIEIIGIQPITYVPGLPRYFKGLINLRGKVVPVIDVRLKFNQPERDYNDKTCIIIVTVDEMQVGLIVDRVAEVVAIGQEQRKASPAINARSGERYLSFIAKAGDKVVLNIDCDKFFQSDLRPF